MQQACPGIQDYLGMSEGLVSPPGTNWIFKSEVAPSEEIDLKGRENKRLNKYSKVCTSPWTALKGEEYIQ